MKDIGKRFWSKVAKRGPDECWLWTASFGSTGYGQFEIDGKPRKAHRVAYMLIHGDIPSSVKVRHSCDNPPCCNPAHLIAGTQADNVKDMVERGRDYRGVPKIGESHGMSKLNDELVIQIRALGAQGFGPTHIKKKLELDITVANLSCILLRKTWTHIP